MTDAARGREARGCLPELRKRLAARLILARQHTPQAMKLDNDIYLSFPLSNLLQY